MEAGVVATLKFVTMLAHPMLNAITATAKKKRVHHNQLKRDHQLFRRSERV